MIVQSIFLGEIKLVLLELLLFELKVKLSDICRGVVVRPVLLETFLLSENSGVP